MIRVSSMASRRCSGSSVKAGRQQAHGLRHEQPGQHQQNELRQQQQSEDAVGEQSRRPFAALAVNMRVSRHERSIERAFGKNRPEMIRQSKRHKESIRDRSGAKDGREHDVAREAGQPRKQRIAADGENTSEHPPFLQHGAALQNGEIE